MAAACLALREDDGGGHASAAPPTVVNGISGTEYLLGMLLLAVSVLGATGATVIIHGLTA